MLRKSLAILSGAVIVSSLGAAISSPSYAQTAAPFSCDRPSLTTVVGRAKKTVISWRSFDFISSGYDPLTRCMDVSDRFNKFYRSGQLDYITAGIVNGMPVICAASPGSSCNRGNVLFTLSDKNRGNVADILQKLFDNRQGLAGDTVVNESSGRVYIDMKKMLTNLGVDANEPGEQEPGVVNDNPSTAPSTAPSGGGW